MSLNEPKAKWDFDHLVKDQKTKAKSKLSNRDRYLSDVDQRSTWARRFRDLIALHLEDLGGWDFCSAAEKAIIRRCAALIVECEQMETKFALAGGAKAEDLDLYARVTGQLRRALETVGLQRRPKDVTGNLPGGLPRWLPPSELRHEIRNQVEDALEESK